MNRINILKSVCCISIIVCLFDTVYAQEQQNDPKQEQQKLIIDKKIRYGRLPNGLTYYIRHNEKPKERAEFYIVHDVGSMQEEDNQRGLAHFLEHMAFNGSDNFPSKKGIQEYLENMGMRNGENINAYTGFDETVYMLMNVPVTRESIIDSCLLVLHDWSSALLLENEEIEKERGVIREEWRKSRTSMIRLWEQQLPKMYPQSRYGNRLPIGLLGIIENFRREELVDYYKKWYRPDLQAIIIVGDIDAEQIEQKIKNTFSDIQRPENPEPKALFIVPNNKIPLVSIATDKEVTNTNLYIFYKHEKIPWKLKGTIVDLLTNYTMSIIKNIMRERFADIIQKPDAPFTAAYASDGDYFVSKTKSAWTTVTTVKNNELEKALKALVAETEKVKKFGFSEAEYERARDNILKMYENAYNERDNEENNAYAQEYIAHFTNGDYIPGIEIEYELIKKIAPEIPVEGINNYLNNIFRESENFENIVIGLTGPEKDDMIYPTEEELLMMFVSAANESVEDNDEEFISKELIEKLPEPGKIVAENIDPVFGSMIYTMSNGAKVIIKQTDYKKDEIVMNAISPGGQTMFKDEKDTWNLKILNNAILLGGLGDFTAPNLMKALSGKKVSFNMGLAPSVEIINASAATSNLKTLFEIVYLQFTSLRKDENAYLSFKERTKSRLENMSLDPEYNFTDTLKSILYDNNPKERNLKAADFNQIDYDRIIEMYNERFADASDFIFTFVGNINIDTIKPLIEQYLASLPALNRSDKPDETQVTPYHKGIVKKEYKQKLETPKSLIHLMYTGTMQYDLKNIIKAQLLNEILDMSLYDKIRETESASYYIFTSVDVYEFPLGRTSLQINFETNPALYREMINIVNSELLKIADQGPDDEYFNKSVLSVFKKQNELIQENDYWLNAISTFYSRNFDLHTEYLTTLKEITKGGIKEFARELFEQGNQIELVMTPE